MKNIYKILLVGDTGTGKSSILSRYNNNYFTKNIPTTVGIDFVSKQISMNKELIDVQIWDTAGQEKYRSITKGYYKGCHGIIICCDMTEIESVHNINKWLISINDVIGLEIPIIIAVNKCDRKDKCIDLKLIEEYNYPKVFCSAFNGVNINNLFDQIINMIHIQRRNTILKRSCMPMSQVTTDDYNDITIDIDDNKKENRVKNNKCC